MALRVLELFGARVRFLREEQGLSVSQVATHLGISDKQLYAIESGRSGTIIENLVSLALVLRCDLADFFVFPETHARQKARELIRLAPNAKLDAVVAAIEEALAADTALIADAKKAPRRSR